MQLEKARSAQAGGVDRRRELIEATIVAIAEHGLSSLTLAKVAAHAGLTAASVNFHFTSKEVLLRETLGQLAEEFEGAVKDAVAEAGDDAGAGLLAITRVLLDPALSAPEKVAVWYAFVSESRARVDYHRVCGELDRSYFGSVLALFRVVIAAGDGRPVDAEAVTHGLLGLLESQWQEILFEGDGYDRAAARRRCRAYLASLCPWRFDMPAAVEAPARSAPDTAPAPPVTLPARAYRDPAFFALERAHIFDAAWHVVCHVSDVPRTGDYATFEMLDERAFVIRGGDGTLRAFHNVCRHRAHAVVTGERGRCPRSLVCPYHGWTYDLDGTLKGVPDDRGFAAFERGDYGLKALELEVFMGFVFIRFRGGRASVAERLAPYAEEMAHYRMDEMVALGETWIRPIEVDWKNAMDNYLEDYHFATGHPGLAALMEKRYDKSVSPTGAARASHRIKSREQRPWSLRHYQRLLPEISHLPEDLRRRWTYVTLFPNINFDIAPDQMDFFQIVPAGPGRCIMRGRSYGLPDERRETRAVRYLNRRINMAVQNEDNTLTLSVQGGLSSSAYDMGFLCDKEVVVKGFHDWIRAQLPAAAFHREHGTAK